MNLIRRHQSDAGVVMVAIIPVEEVTNECLCILDAAEALWKLRLVFQRLEAAFGKRIVVRRIWPAVRFGDAQISEQQGCGLAFIGPPRSAWSVSWPGSTPCFSTVALNRG
jgi:hypothetical protein